MEIISTNANCDANVLDPLTFSYELADVHFEQGRSAPAVDVLSWMTDSGVLSERW